MGRLSRCAVAASAAAAIGLLVAGDAAAFDGFGEATAESTFGDEIRFDVELIGEAPDRLELLLRTPEGEGSFVTTVEADGESATYVWETSVDFLTPSTPVTYRWRATVGDDVTLGPEQTIRYDDDRPGLDWQQAQLGETTVHWYGGAEAQARRFGELTAVGVTQAEDLLGTTLAGPVEVFVYDSAGDFRGALGPGAREWTGAAAFPELRTIFMWLGGGTEAYLEVAMVHEVTHIVFFDATDNPYHEPARWLNEGIATWSESGDAGEQRDIVSFEASGGGLFSFDAITEQFPLGERGARLSYAQGTTMIGMIIDRYGREAIAAIGAAYRDGASDAEALEAGTGISAEQLYADFYAEFGVDIPQAIEPNPIPPSNVDRPEAGAIDEGGVEAGASSPPVDGTPEEAPAADGGILPLIGLLGVAAVAAVGAAVWVARRASRAGQA